MGRDSRDSGEHKLEDAIGNGGNPGASDRRLLKYVLETEIPCDEIESACAVRKEPGVALRLSKETPGSTWCVTRRSKGRWRDREGKCYSLRSPMYLSAVSLNVKENLWKGVESENPT